jgi:hypothetical protein
MIGNSTTDLLIEKISLHPLFLPIMKKDFVVEFNTSLI